LTGTDNIAGGFLGGIAIGKGRFFGSNRILFYGAFLKMISDVVFTTLTPNKFPLALGMGFLAMFGMGLSLVALIVCVQLASDDKHIGLATLVLGSIRAIGGSVAVTIYTSIMNNTLQIDLPQRVGKALVPLGVTAQNVGKLLAVLKSNPKHPELALQIPGVTPQILGMVGEISKWSWAKAFQNIYYAAVAFSVMAVIASLFVKDISQNMTDNIAVTLKNEKTSKKVEAV
jgi:Fungal trichothecene efflux pump (TRI12)